MNSEHPEHDTINVTTLSNELEFETDVDKARVLAIPRAESIRKNNFRIIVALRLDLESCVVHTCICGSKVDRIGRHSLSCSGRFPLYAELNHEKSISFSGFIV